MSQHGPRHPILSVAPRRGRPTRIAAGLREVADERAQRHAPHPRKRKAPIASHGFPGRLPPGSEAYLVDQRHVGLAMLEEALAQVPAIVQRDFSWLDPATFWRTMEFDRAAQPYDERGARTDYAAIPAGLTQLRDDPCRSLAAHGREAGGCAKDATPYAEFLWVALLWPEFLWEGFRRARITPKDAAQPGARALERALAPAHRRQAGDLPGWSGATE